jgi:hypothetical protein
MGKKIEIKEIVMEELENIQTELAPRLQEIYDEGFFQGAASREVEVEELKTKITNMQSQINAIIKALGSE